MIMDKCISLDNAVKLVKNGDTVAFGGNVLHRSPVRIAAKLALTGVKELTIIKTAIAIEADILCGAGCAKAVIAGFVGYETQFGLCGFYRKAVESGETTAIEHSCYSVITALRGAAQGVPFLPVRGMLGSELIKCVGFKMVTDPYTGEELCAVQSVCPDVAFIHAQKADRVGNAEIAGPFYEDEIVARSAKTLVITCEEFVDDDYFGRHRKADISQVLTNHVVLANDGASPGSCEGCYDVDETKMELFKKLKTREELLEYLGTVK